MTVLNVCHLGLSDMRDIFYMVRFALYMKNELVTKSLVCIVLFCPWASSGMFLCNRGGLLLSDHRPRLKSMQLFIVILEKCSLTCPLSLSIAPSSHGPTLAQYGCDSPLFSCVLIKVVRSWPDEQWPSEGALGWSSIRLERLHSFLPPDNARVFHAFLQPH